MGTVISCALPLADHADGRRALAAGLPARSYTMASSWKVTCLAVRIGKVTQCAATFLHRTRQHIAHGRVQAGSPGG
jgi:hypothetical protein